MFTGTFVPAHHTLDVLILVIDTVSAILRVLRWCLSIDKRHIRILERKRVNIRGDWIQVTRRSQRVQTVGQRVQTRRDGG